MAAIPPFWSLLLLSLNLLFQNSTKTLVAYASVINTTQLRQIALNALINKSKKTLVSYSQHQIKPRRYITLLVPFNDKKLNVNFYTIDSKQKLILSGKVCQAFDLVERVLKTHVNLKELLDQHPDLQNASGAMPGTFSINLLHSFLRLCPSSKKWRQKGI